MIELFSEKAQAKLVDELIELVKEELGNRVALGDILTHEDLKERLGLSSSSIRNLMADGLPFHKFPNSRKLYFFENEVKEFMN